MASAVGHKRITDDLCASLGELSFALPVTHVYNPLVYARKPWDRYVKQWGQGKKEVVMLGMNPGPWGMAQTGVPFGEIGMARDFLKCEAPVARPAGEHEKRPILGYDCHRSEPSGRRLWGWVEEDFGSAEAFFKRYFVANYCPLIFLEESGRNRTPNKLPVAERQALFEICDLALRRLVKRLKPRLVLGIGRFAEGRAIQALDGLDVEIDTVLHPSPANPAANQGWAPKMRARMKELGL